jgi:hypothetical protein
MLSKAAFFRRSPAPSVPCGDSRRPMKREIRIKEEEIQVKNTRRWEE